MDIQIYTMTTPNTALEPTASAPLVLSREEFHGCSFLRRGSALDR